MKAQIKLILLSSFFAGNFYGQQLQNKANNTTGENDAVLIKGSTTGQPASFLVDRLGHLDAGVYGDGWGTWTSIGRPLLAATIPVPPNDQTLYGMSIMNDGDRAFFGTRRKSSNYIDAVLAWGDDEDLSGTSDRMVFEFHNSHGSGNVANHTIKNAMTLMPNGSNDVFVGIGLYTPTEQLHTNEGVRFEGLTTGGNPNNLVAIDANGKLWRAPLAGSGGSTLGNYCSGTANVLTGNYRIGTGGYDFNFTDDNTSVGDKVQVGVPCNVKLPGKFNVSTTLPSDPANSLSSTSIYAVNTNNTQNNFSTTGVNGRAISANGKGNTDNRGISGYAEGEGRSVGVYGEAGLGGGNPSGAGTTGAYGGLFKALYTSGTNYGIYATAKNGSTNYAGYFDGDVVINAGSGSYALMVNGSTYQTSGGAWTASDSKFKREIKTLENVSEKIKNLNGYTYYFKTEENADRHFDKGQQIGFIAQELKEIFPQLVTQDPNGDLAVNYQGMIPVLLEALKGQQKQLDEQKQLINELKSSTATGINKVNTIETGFQMSQNEPNPFTHETVVKYTLPQTISNAFVAVYDLTGKQIATFPINEKGSSSLTITSEKLAAGIYIYSIVADGKVVDSKRMIIAEK